METKYVSTQMNRHDPSLETAVFALQTPEVLAALEEITGFQNIVADKYLYAGGISVMERGHFLNPHIDTSHDKDRQLYRALNLLDYLSPGWLLEYGGTSNPGPTGRPGGLSRFGAFSTGL